MSPFTSDIRKLTTSIYKTYEGDYVLFTTPKNRGLLFNTLKAKGFNPTEPYKEGKDWLITIYKRDFPVKINPTQRKRKMDNPSYLPDLSGSKYPADYVIGVIWGIVTNKQDHAVNRVLKIKKVLIEYGKSVNSQVLVDKPVLSNPPVIIYDNLIEIKAQKKRGNFKGEYFKHTFKPGSKVYGLSNGDLLISKR